MSKTFMRGLALLELIDVHGPVTVTELARLSGLDKSVVSRMITGCEPDGWVVRSDGKLGLGPRAALLGHSSPAGTAIRQAEPLVHAVAGVTGMLTQVYALVGSRAVIIASASGRGPSVPTGLGIGVPLFATAAGMTVAAQLDPAELERLLPPEPFPDATQDLVGLAGYAPASAAMFANHNEPLRSSPSIARNRSQLAAQMEIIRRDGVAIDDGDLHPEMGCTAIPWARPGLPAALACMGSPADLAGSSELVRSALDAAAAPGARPDDVVAAAARAIHARPSQVMRMITGDPPPDA
ncbi:MAG: MarR family transcriptional regulator [Solirubrobacteraceae bacterium]